MKVSNLIKQCITEAANSNANITMNILLLIKLLEWAFEDAENDVDLYKLVENITNSGKDILTMNDYELLIPSDSIEGCQL